MATRTSGWAFRCSPMAFSFETTTTTWPASPATAFAVSRTRSRTGGPRLRAGLSSARTSSSRRGPRRGVRQRSCASRDELRETLRSPEGGEVGFESGLNAVLVVGGDGLLQALERLVDVPLKREAAGREVVHAAVAVAATRVPAEEVERLVDIAAVRFEHGRVVQLLRLGRGGALRLLSSAARPEVHPRAVALFLLLRILPAALFPPPRRPA